MKESHLRNIQVVATFALFLGVPSIAEAARHSSVDKTDGTIRVSYSDLDLSSDDGVETLYKRLQRVSGTACETGGFMEKGSLRAVIEAKACYADTLNRLVAEVRNEKLTAMHES